MKKSFFLFAALLIAATMFAQSVPATPEPQIIESGGKVVVRHTFIENVQASDKDTTVIGVQTRVVELPITSAGIDEQIKQIEQAAQKQITSLLGMYRQVKTLEEKLTPVAAKPDNGTKKEGND